MHIAFDIACAGAIVGFIVGLTGMGGGALMTPILVIFFGIQPLAAVSSDLVASLIMKPVGAGVHWRAKTVKAPLVKWLCLGSIPAAFAGVLLLRSLPGSEADLQDLATELLHEPQDLLDADDADAPVVRLVNSLLQQAVKERASDIHIEPFEKEFRIRFRVDGVLFNQEPPPRELKAAIISRLKLMAKLNIA